MDSHCGGGGGAEPSFPPFLNRPLNQITEEDISQLTREDCRKYLKHKGMRKPSWNKSQALQQVLSLKALLETSEGFSMPHFGKAETSKLSYKEYISANISSDASERNSVPDDVAACIKQFSHVNPIGCHISSEASPRNPDLQDHLEQMTIFYRGMVNVYDKIPAEKALDILNLAASPVSSCMDDHSMLTPDRYQHGTSTSCGTECFTPNTSNVYSSSQTGEDYQVLNLLDKFPHLKSLGITSEYCTDIGSLAKELLAEMGDASL